MINQRNLKWLKTCNRETLGIFTDNSVYSFTKREVDEKLKVSDNKNI